MCQKKLEVKDPISGRAAGKCGSVLSAEVQGSGQARGWACLLQGQVLLLGFGRTPLGTPLSQTNRPEIPTYWLGVKVPLNRVMKTNIYKCPRSKPEQPRNPCHTLHLVSWASYSPTMQVNKHRLLKRNRNKCMLKNPGGLSALPARQFFHKQQEFDQQHKQKWEQWCPEDWTGYSTQRLGLFYPPLSKDTKPTLNRHWEYGSDGRCTQEIKLDTVGGRNESVSDT